MTMDDVAPPLGSAYKHSKRDRRRTEILDAAATVFAQKGYFAATMQDIAERLGMRPGSLYYYFRSKEAALEEVCRRGGRAYVDALDALLSSEQPTLSVIEQAIEAHLASDWRDYVANFAFNRRNLPDGVLTEMNAIAREYTAQWKALLDRGVTSGDLAPDLDTRFAASAILAVVNSSVMPGSQGGKGTEAAARKALALVLNGIRRADG